VAVALLAGATLGPALDGIHSSVGLQVYDLLPLGLFNGALQTSALVPPLLAAFYATLTLLDGAAERLEDGDDSDADPPPSLPTTAACYASLAAGLALSATLHANQVPPPQIAAALAAFAAANFGAFDRTRRGLALALLCAAVAPLAEAQLMARFGAWHYPRADVAVPVLFAAGLFSPAGGGGASAAAAAPAVPLSVPFVSWVPLCYFFYVPSVLLLGRRLRAASRARRRRGG
jgi:heat shock protein 5